MVIVYFSESHLIHKLKLLTNLLYDIYWNDCLCNIILNDGLKFDQKMIITYKV